MTLPADVTARLSTLLIRDADRLGRRLRQLGPDRAAELEGDLTAAEERVARRRAAVPAVTYPPGLPVTDAVEEIRAALRDHQVVVVAGETGSGKTTQLPKVCLELGRGVRGRIGHTQPRRIAARAVAERIAEELGVPLGGAVGYAVRFTDQVGPDTVVKLMTDGVLLAEIQRDRDLLAYDTLILDEAHERSLNVDFLLGYLAQLLPRRPDLKLLITSATIDPVRFAEHFGGAPVVEVSGRTYPVEVRYRPVVDPEDPATADRDTTQAVLDAVTELTAAGPGDVLVFLSGEREIRDTADALRGADLRGTEVVPLYARLSAAEQHRVFAPHTGRRIVLATNVAETSLTVPGIRYVVDPGLARISRWSRRHRVQRLPIEPVSQASAAQRAGRCGRVADGICIRLYSEADHDARPAFTDPEILRTDLAAIVLQMTALRLGDVNAFPFLDPPDRRAVGDALDLLHELGALEPGSREQPRLTPVGRQLARLPLDPRLGRMILAADREDCVREVLVIAAGLTVQDPRERPADAQQAADEAHRRHADDGSDFLGLLNLWDHVREQQRELSSGAFRRECRAEFLHYLRIREWQDLRGQLRQVARELGVVGRADGDGERAPADAVHRAVLAGLLSHVGARDERARDYQGARGARFVIAPGSALSRRQPRWVVAAELVETHRLQARTVARVDPEWVERLAGHLVLRTYSEPRWDRRRGGVVATERVTLYGLPLVTGRRVDYGRVDPEVSRELFLRHALVEGDWDTHHAFWATNSALLAEVDDLEQRARRRDLRVDDETLFDFYDARVPAEVTGAGHFDRWWKLTRRDQPDLLTLPRVLLLDPRAGEVSTADFPDAVRAGDVRLPLTYRFDPGATDDGVTVHVPLAVLPQVAAEGLVVPGQRAELVTALLRALPKGLRRQLGPAPDLAATVLPQLGDGPLLEALSREVRRATGVAVAHDDWDPAGLPEHLRVRFRVVGEDDRTVGEGKDLAALQRSLAPRVRAAVAAAAGAGVERTGLRAWEVGTLPRSVVVDRGGHAVTGWPALVDEGATVGVRVLAAEAEQRRLMVVGTRRLLQLGLPDPSRLLRAELSPARSLALSRAPHGTLGELLADCVAAAVDALVQRFGGPAWDEEGFATLRAMVRGELPATTAAVLRLVEQVVAAAADVETRLSGLRAPVTAAAAAEVREQLAALVFPGFVTATGLDRLPDLVRWLRAADRRLERLPADPARDRVLAQRVERMQAEIARERDRLPPGSATRAEVEELRFAVEELRVSLFAQALGTRGPVSEERILRRLDALVG